MRKIVIAALTALFAAFPAQAASVIWNAGSWGSANWPGYYDGLSGVGYAITLAQDIPDQQRKTVALSDLSAFSAGWWVDMRISPITQQRRGQSWIGSLADVEEFSADVKSEGGRLTVFALFLKTRFVDPSYGDAGIGATQLFIFQNSFGFNDRNGNGASGTTYGVPEPAAWALMIAGFGFVGCGLRRSRQTARSIAPSLR